jgi:hypothetical protein
MPPTSPLAEPTAAAGPAQQELEGREQGGVERSAEVAPPAPQLAPLPSSREPGPGEPEEAPAPEEPAMAEARPAERAPDGARAPEEPGKPTEPEKLAEDEEPTEAEKPTEIERPAAAADAEQPEEAEAAEEAAEAPPEEPVAPLLLPPLPAPGAPSARPPVASPLSLPPLTLPPPPGLGMPGARPLTPPPPAEPAPPASGVPAPPAVPATAGPAEDRDAILAALDDPATGEIVVIAGRRSRVLTDDGWSEVGGEVSAADWQSLWQDIAERTGAPSEASSGHVAHLGAGGIVVEAMLPPLSADPVLHLRRRPPEASLDTWIEDGRVEGDAAAVRDAIGNRRGVLVIGDRGSGRTALLEALAGAIASGDRVAALETLPQLRMQGALRLRLDAASAAPALGAARASMAEWLVLDDASPQAVAAAALDAEASGAALLVSARTSDADAWLGQVARALAYEVADADAFLRSALSVVVRVTRGSDGRPRADVVRS